MSIWVTFSEKASLEHTANFDFSCIVQHSKGNSISRPKLKQEPRIGWNVYVIFSLGSVDTKKSKDK